MPKYSIIIPVYNVGKFIAQCLDSICGQTFGDFEAIVVDDGSPDNAPAICDEFAKKDSRIKVFHKQNGGVGAALNYGLDYATGEWIYFVDGDDWIESNTLETFENYLKKYPEVDILDFNNYYNEIEKELKNKLLFPANRILESAEIEKLKISTLFPKWIERKYGYSLPVIRARWSKVFNRNLIYSNNLRFRAELTTGEDALFIFECFSNASKVVLVNEYLYHYRFYGESTIHRYCEKWDHIFARLKLTKEIGSSDNQDFTVAVGLLAWEGLRAFLERFLFHSKCKLTFKQKKRALSEYLKKFGSQNICISRQIIRYMPEYFVILFLMKFRCVWFLMFLGRVLYGRV